VPPNPLCQSRTQPSRGDGDLQCPTAHDGWGDEIALVWRVDHVHPDLPPAGRFAYRSIHRMLVRCPDDQRASHHIIFDKRARLMANDTMQGESRQGGREHGADHDHRRPRLEKPLDFAGGDFASAHDQAAFSF
jgi:hypothetical protein